MKLKAILADNAYLLKIVFRHARGYAALTVCTAILIAADNVAANALMPRYLTDALARRAPLREICSVLALMAAAGLGTQLLYELPILHLLAVAGRVFAASNPNRKTYRPMTGEEMAMLYRRR